MIQIAIVVLVIMALGGFSTRRSFTKRLKKEMPSWIEQGWVQQENAQQIIDSTGSQSKHSASTAFSILGVLLFAVGVISFIASNWGEISKLGKLLILFGVMWGAFAGASWCRNQSHITWLAESALLLAVMMFGANIMLIAQIYHIDAHYPNGVMIWSFGALLTSWMMKSRVLFVVSMMLTTLWTGMESFGFQTFHWPFLIVIALHAWLMVINKWKVMAHLLMISFLLWSLFCISSFGWWDEKLHLVYLVQSYLLFYLLLFLSGMHLVLEKGYEYYGELIKKYAALASLSAFYVLTVPQFLESRSWGSGGNVFRNPADQIWIWVTAIFLILLAISALWHRSKTKEGRIRKPYHTWGLLLLSGLLGCIVINLFSFGEAGGAAAIAFNLLFFASLLWLIYFGMHEGNRQLVNLSFVFFAITLLNRYFDTFWELLDRSLFFMAGGILVVGLGIVLERKRRSLMVDLGSDTGGAA